MKSKKLQLKRILVFILLLNIGGMPSTFAQFTEGKEFTEGKFEYLVLHKIVDKNDISIWVTGHVDGEKAKGELVIPETVSWEGKEYPVSGIWGFGGCSGLTSINIPTSVKIINDYSFSGCSGLTSITIPNSVETIGAWAFSGCAELTTIDVPSSVTYIDGYAFEDCTKLASISLPKSTLTIMSNAFNNTKWYNEQPDGLLYLDGCCMGYKGDKPCGRLQFNDDTRLIASSAFYDCNELTSVSIPNSLTIIGTSAFADCSGLTSITLPKSVHSCGDRAFINTGWYNSQPDGVLYLGDCCLGYKGDKPHGHLQIKDGTRIIASNAFNSCVGLTSISIPNSVTSIGEDAFCCCRKLISIFIPNSVTSIEANAFKDCTGFQGELVIPNSVTSIGSGAFSYCTGLTSITIPNSVTSIGDGAFAGCTGLTSISIPNSITTMGKDAFEGCANLAVDGERLQSRKRYNGEFKMIGFDFSGSETVAGKAQYDYCDAPDGTRIFDGRFMFCDDFTDLQNWSAYKPNMVAEDISLEDIEKIFSTKIKYLALGRFSQDKQVGKWIWISYSYGATSPSIYVCVINFNDKGVPEGDFEHYQLFHSSYDEQKYHNAPKYYKGWYLSATIENGVIVFIDSKSCGYGYNVKDYVSGRYNKEGYPIGKWSFSGTDYTDFGKYIFVEFDDKGNCIKNYRIDQTTGDHVGLSYNMVRRPIRTAWGAINCISNRRFRSTPHVQWRQNGIMKYGDY